jgi:hypothetical protein
MISLKFLTRSGCHLCDEARPLIKEEVARIHGVVEEIDIDKRENARWARDYGLRIPVLLGPGEVVIGEGVMARGALRNALGRYRGRIG